MAVRVYQLAKELGTNSKGLLQLMKDMGEYLRSASSTVKAPVARKVRERLARDPGALRRAAFDATPSPAPARPPEPTGMAINVVLKLHPVEINAIEISHHSHPGFQVRVDKVSDEDHPYWLSVYIHGQQPPIPGTWMTLNDWKLPLTPIDTPLQQLPGLGVRQLTDERSAGSLAEQVTVALLGNHASEVKLTVEECDQAEANRRYGITVLVHRRHGTGGRRRLPETNCLKCGLPLSDPVSIKVGVGPTCRRNMAADAIHALSNPKSARHVVLGARKPKAWVAVIRTRFASFHQPESVAAAPD
jgi:hypothetical protein